MSPRDLGQQQQQQQQQLFTEKRRVVRRRSEGNLIVSTIKLFGIILLSLDSSEDDTL